MADETTENSPGQPRECRCPDDCDCNGHLVCNVTVPGTTHCCQESPGHAGRHYDGNHGWDRAPEPTEQAGREALAARLLRVVDAGRIPSLSDSEARIASEALLLGPTVPEAVLTAVVADRDALQRRLDEAEVRLRRLSPCCFECGAPLEQANLGWVDLGGACFGDDGHEHTSDLDDEA